MFPGRTEGCVSRRGETPTPSHAFDLFAGSLLRIGPGSIPPSFTVGFCHSGYIESEKRTRTDAAPGIHRYVPPPAHPRL